MTAKYLRSQRSISRRTSTGGVRDFTDVFGDIAVVQSHFESDNQPPHRRLHPSTRSLYVISFGWCAMRSSFSSCFLYLCALSILPLAGCAGIRPAPTPSPSPSTTQTFQLTVTAPPAGQGTITSSPAGISCPSTCTASFAQGTKVTLTATPGTNYLFSGWSGACTGTSCTVTINAATTVAASFIETEGLNVALAGTGSGTVTSTPAGINCPTTCSAAFPDNTQVTLTETAGTNFYFGGWSGACSGATSCSVTVTAAENVTATFTTGDSITVTTSGTGTGNVTSTPSGINCTSGSTTGCTATFPPGTAVTLAETPTVPNIFSGWSGACSGSAACSVTVSATPASVTAAFAQGGTLQTSLQHIILYAQENRSLDHYFGQMEAYWASIGLHQTDGVTFDGLPQTGALPSVPECAPGTWGGSCSPDPSNPISSFHLASSCIENQSPFWNEAHNQWDYSDPSGSNPNDLANPPLDGFAFTAAYDAQSNGFMDIEGARAMGYYDGDDLTYYYFLASNFATSDRWFAPIMSRTQLNRMYLIGATSDGHAYPIGEGGNIIGGLPGNPANPSDGKQIPSMPIFEELQNAGVSWRIYVDPTGTPCEGETGSQLSSCLTQNSYINEFTYEETILNSPTLLANVQPISQYQTDVANNALPAFALIEPASPAGLDEHPSDSDEYAVNVQDGMAYSANTVINPLMQSPSWSTSALIFTYDEWGGLYDHVAPQPATAPGDYAYPTDLDPSLHDICTGSGQLGNGMCSFSWTGFRVPVVVISPFANKNYVSHTVRDTTSVLNFVEERFGLAPLTKRDGSQPAMDEFFNFTNPQWLTPPTTPSSLENTTLQCNQQPPASWNEPPQLSVAVSGSGTITSNPAGINCSSDYGSACGYVFAPGTQVTLTATPDAGGTFTDWSGAGQTPGACGTSTSPTCTITVNSAAYAEAKFQ
jgi:phospholipase C